MRTLIVSHYFPPEIGAPQARLSDLARMWADHGDDVTVLTGMPSHPTGVIPPRYRGRHRCVEHQDGYRIVRVWLYATPNKGFVRRTLGHLSFMVTSVVVGRTGKADVVVVSSPTFFSVLSAWLLARVKRARFVIEVRDLWPAILIELSVLTIRPAIRVLELLELAAYRAADRVVVVTEGFRDDLVRRGIPSSKIQVVFNGVDLDRFHSSGSAEQARTWLGAPEASVLTLYIGAHGISHGLTTIAQAAALLAGQPIHFAFVGEGSAKEELAHRIRELSSGNVSLRDGVDRTQVPGLVAAADICLVPLRDVPLFSTFIPSKMFEFFAAEKAVVGSVSGEAARILADAGAMVVPPGNVEAVAAAISELAADPQRRAAMGAQAGAYVREHFDRRRIAETYRLSLHQTVERAR